MTVKVPDSPEWNPLLTRLASHQCAAFMYMGHVGPVHLYKHVITRRYLNLDGAGNCYVWDGQGEDVGNYISVNFAEQVIHVTGARA